MVVQASCAKLWRGKLRLNEPLAKYTSWRVGGIAKRLYCPADLTDLSFFLSDLPDSEKLLYLGLGSNLLIRDGGFNGTVLLMLGGLTVLEQRNDTLIRAEAGVSCATMARFCARHNLSGAEFLAGVPGTIGGALRMNAGCFGGETWNIVVTTETIDRQGRVKKRFAEDYQVGYRQVKMPHEKPEWFVAAEFKLKKGDKEQSLATIRDCLARRAKTQPTGEHSCGSVFRNPPNDYAARLIEQCGLKGFELGGAKVSEKHANFIINFQQASAQNIEQLIDQVARQVFETQGVCLQREVHIVGQREKFLNE